MIAHGGGMAGKIASSTAKWIAKRLREGGCGGPWKPLRGEFNSIENGMANDRMECCLIIRRMAWTWSTLSAGSVLPARTWFPLAEHGADLRQQRFREARL